MRMPKRVILMTQTIKVETAPNLHHPMTNEDGEEHGHRAYGVYSEAEQTITLDSALRFERARETFLHENLHAMFNVGQIDSILDAEAHGLGEHLVGSLAPIMLAWLRENPHAVAWLQEVQQ